MDRLQRERAQRFIDTANALTHANRGTRLHAPYNPDMQQLAAEIRAIQAALDYMPDPDIERVKLLRNYATAHRRLAIHVAEIAEREEQNLIRRQGQRVEALV
jgi:hypothetical protein